MAPHIKEDALAAMLEGIITAFHAAQPRLVRPPHDSFSQCMEYARAAFAALEAGGFTIVWKGAHSPLPDWRDRHLPVAAQMQG